MGARNKVKVWVLWLWQSIFSQAFMTYILKAYTRMYDGPHPGWQREVELQRDTELPLGGAFVSDAQSFTRPQCSDNWFFGFIFISKHQIITWPSVISPVSAQDESASLNLQHGSPWLYQTIHFPCSIFLSPPHHFTSLFLSLFITSCLPEVKRQIKIFLCNW